MSADKRVICTVVANGGTRDPIMPVEKHKRSLNHRLTESLPTCGRVQSSPPDNMSDENDTTEYAVCLFFTTSVLRRNSAASVPPPLLPAIIMSALIQKRVWIVKVKDEKKKKTTIRRAVQAHPRWRDGGGGVVSERFPLPPYHMQLITSRHVSSHLVSSPLLARVRSLKRTLVVYISCERMLCIQRQSVTYGLNI